MSRNGHTFKAFAGLCESVAGAIGAHDAIIDGEMVCLDDRCRAQFYPLLYRRANPCYYAFDCLWLDDRDLRRLPLVERKRILRSLVPAERSRLLYVDHIEEHGVALFGEVRRRDMEGIVAKRKDGVYDPEAPTWIKIKNRQYSQAVGCHERFERMRLAAGTASA